MHGYQPILPMTRQVATKMKELRQAATGPVVTIENGDFIKARPKLLHCQKPAPVAALTAVVNHLDVDVHVLGNHEFNYGLPYLQEAIASYQTPVLAANILNEAGNHSLGKLTPSLKKKG